MIFPISLIGELLAVKPDPAHIERIQLPDWKRSLSGKVLATGPDATSAVIGDTVYFGAAVGMDSVLSGENIRILKDSDLDFVYTGEVDNFGRPFPSHEA